MPIEKKQTVFELLKSNYDRTNRANNFRKRMFINSKESKALAETVNIPKFFTEVIPLSEKEAESVFTHQENGDLRVRDDYMNLILGHYEVEQSLKKERIIEGVLKFQSTKKGTPGLGFYHGGVEIFVPYQNFLTPEMSRELAEILKDTELNQKEIDEYRQLIATRLGSKVKVIVTHYLPDNRFAVASRTKAMKRERYEAFIVPDRQMLIVGGETVLAPAVTEGNVIRANVVSVINSHIICEFMGVEFMVSTQDLNMGYLSNAQDRFQPGNKVDLRVTEVKVSEYATEEEPDVELEAVGLQGLDYFETLSKLYKAGLEKASGYVTNIHDGNIFVRVDMSDKSPDADFKRHRLRVNDYVDVICKYPEFHNRAIQVGDLATIKITGFNDETRKGFFGTINRTWGGVQNS